MNDRWDEGRRARDERDRGPLVFGIVLILVGAIFFVSEYLHIDIGGETWPLFVIVPGLALLVLGFSIGGDGGLGAAIPGGIVTTVGLLLAFQNATDSWASWAYAWALVAPGSVGVTMLLYGIVHRRSDLVDAGLRTAAVGGVLFVAFGLFFENVIQVDRESGTSLMRDAFPILAVVLGILIVVGNLIWRPRPERDSSRTERPASTPSGTATAPSSEPPAPPEAPPSGDAGAGPTPRS